MRLLFRSVVTQLLTLQNGGVVACACLATYLLVVNGLDWQYFLATSNTSTRPLLFLADGLGFLIPVFLPLGMFGFALYKKRTDLRLYSLGMMLAAALGFFVSMFIKVFTGRISPPHHGPFDVDISSAFQFGFMEHHIIGGWPSSHATVMFALAACVWVLFPQAQRFRLALLVSAFFVALGVTFGFHWFSEFVAGACFGTIIGDAIGKVFNKRVEN